MSSPEALDSSSLPSELLLFQTSANPIRTFFFRREYTIGDMFERIYAENFIQMFKQYSASTDDNGQSAPTKNSCYLGLYSAYKEKPEDFKRIITSAFEQFGRKGDKLNVKLFRLVPFNFRLSQEVKLEIDRLTDSKVNIKEVDYLSNGLKTNIYLVDAVYSDVYVDFQFKLEATTFIHDPVPREYFREIWIEARLYLSNGVVAVLNSDGTAQHTKNILSIIHLLFQKHSPTIQEVSLDEYQLIMIQLRLRGEVSAPKLKSEDDLRVEIHNLKAIHYENPLVKMVESSASLRLYELSSFCVVEGHRFRLSLTDNGHVQVETYVTPDVLDRIIFDINWVMLSGEFYRDTSIDMEELYKKKMLGSLRAHRQNKIDDIRGELDALIRTNKSKVMEMREIKLLATILSNIGQFIMLKGSISSLTEDDLKEYRTEGYEKLISYFEDYGISKARLSKSQGNARATNVVKTLQYLTKVSTGDAVQVVEMYKGLIGTDV